jgi:plasmid maintenance system antidote protein VapI
MWRGKMKPYTNISPGDIIRDEILDVMQHLTSKPMQYVNNFYKRLGIRKDHWQDILAGRVHLTAHVISQLVEVFHMSRGFWLNLDKNYWDRKGVK